MQQEKDRSTLVIIVRNFLIELVVYGILVAVYFMIFLRFLGGPLSILFESNLVVYSVLAMILIVAQGVLLDFVTTFLLDRLKLEQLE